MAAKGFSATQIIAAMPGVIAASEASGESLALTADTVSSALNIWALEAGEAGRVADILATSANVSAAGITDLGYVLKYAGAPASALGISLEELAAAAGLVIDAGIDGSSAGTSLRASLLALNNPAKAQAKIMKELGFSFQDGEGNAKGLAEMIRDMTSATEHMSEADKVATLGKLVGTEAVSGFLALMKAGPDAINANTKALENSAGASQEAADKMMGGIGGAWEEMMGAFESAAILIGDVLVPYVTSFAKKIGELVDKFNNASPAFQDLVVKGTAIAGALLLIGGPLLMLVGAIPSIIAGITSVVTVFGAAKLAIAGLATGIGPLSAALTFLSGPIGLTIAAIAGITVGVIALVRHLKQDAIPEVDRFGKGVSDATKEALGGFFELSDGASQAIADMSINSSRITGEMATDLIGKYSEMNKQILSAMNERHAAQEASMASFFANSSVLTDEQEAAILQKQQNSHDLQVMAQEAKETRIAEIMNAAAEANRRLTQSEQDEINSIQKSMNENAVKYLSQSEVEQKIIMERLKETAGDLSAKQAAEVAKNSAVQREKAVTEAEAQYDQTIAEIIRMRDETGAITEEQAAQMIAEATRARDGSVKQAELMHQEVVERAKAQAGEHIDNVNWETGEVLSKWEVFKNGVAAKWREIVKATGLKIGEMVIGVKKKFEEIRDGVLEKMVEVKEKIETGWKTAEAFLKGINLLQIGKDVVQGLIDGISGKFKDVKAKVSELANLLPDVVKNLLGIHSPIEKSSPKTKKRAAKLAVLLKTMKPSEKIQAKQVSFA
ncbi:phage tail tape measure protein [Sporosarcina sp. ACRSL]|nr:phage tail tape measure protein [Sporosarcina sp. ACRSL]